MAHQLGFTQNYLSFYSQAIFKWALLFSGLCLPGAKAQDSQTGEGFSSASVVVRNLNEALRETLSQQEKRFSKLAEQSLEDQELLHTKLGLIYLEQAKFKEAEEQFEKALQKDFLADYNLFFLAQAQERQNKLDQAKANLEKIQKLKPNFRLTVESRSLLAGILLRAGKNQESLQILQRLERRARGTELYSDLVYQLAQAHKNLGNKNKACLSLRTLYSDFPGHPKIQLWNQDLGQNDFEGSPTGCENSLDDFKGRVRALLWLGQDQKAKAEIETLRKLNEKENKYITDSLLAQFYLQTGDLQKAYDLMKPYDEALGEDFDHLILRGTLAARMGQGPEAVDHYYRAARRAPTRLQARKTLFQSAFLGYQFRDYEGATKRFEEFVRLYPTSGLTKDAQWHLAWLKYLKKDYKASIRRFLALEKKGKRKKQRISDRTQYWLAMSYLRLGQKQTAERLFQDLAQDKLLDFYSLAAQSRLQELKKTPTSAKSTSNSFKFIHRLSGQFPIPGEDPTFFISPQAHSSVEEETEENLSWLLSTLSTPPDVSREEGPASEFADEASALVKGPELKPNIQMKKTPEEDKAREEESVVVSEIKTPRFAQSFQKARDLRLLGLGEWSKWDLYEIEKRTRNKDYLRTLMLEYSDLGNFHRSSYIAQVYFSEARRAQGIEGVRFFWQEAFPQAYKEEVKTWSGRSQIPAHLVWAIMKAESQFRQDAISPVGALGLMQVMPHTGLKLADLNKVRDFKVEDLLRAPRAIQFGSSYLQRLMKKFSSQIPLVAAAYNAGPHRVNNWLFQFGELELDEFIEHIPFLETRNYVKKVSAYFHVYNLIYGSAENSAQNFSKPLPVKIPEKLSFKENWNEL